MGERPEGASPGTCTERRTSAKNLRIDTNQKSKDVQRHISVHIRHIINKKQKCHRASHLKPRRCPLTANRRRRKDTTQDQCKTCELLIHRNETFHCFQYFPIRFAIWVTFPTDTCFWKRSNISFDVFPWNFEGHVSSLAAVLYPSLPLLSRCNTTGRGGKNEVPQTVPKCISLRRGISTFPRSAGPPGGAVRFKHEPENQYLRKPADCILLYEHKIQYTWLIIQDLCNLSFIVLALHIPGHMSCSKDI